MGGCNRVRWGAIASLAAVMAVAVGGSACNSNSNSTAPLVIKVTKIEKPCVPPGAQQTILAKVVKSASVTYAVGYSDGFAHGVNAPTGKADGSGVFHGTWSIPKDAPPGPVNVTVLAASGQRTGKQPTTFKVAKPDGTCE